MTPKRQRRSRSRRGRKNGFSIEWITQYMPISRAYYPASKWKWLAFASLNWQAHG